MVIFFRDEQDLHSERLQSQAIFARVMQRALPIGGVRGSHGQHLVAEAGEAETGVAKPETTAQLEHARIISENTKPRKPMTTTLDEPRVLEIMRQEHVIAEAREAELWDKMKIVEAEMQPYKDRYDEAIRLWSDANRLKMALAACLAAKAQEASAAV